MKPQNALLEIDSSNRASHTCFLANVRSLLGSIRKRHRIAGSVDAAGRNRPDVDEDLPSPTLHDFHAGELEASMLSPSTTNMFDKHDALRFDSPQELARARRVFAATLLVPLLLISALLIVSGNALDRSLISLLQFSTVALAIPLTGSGAAWLYRTLTRRDA